MPDVPIIRLQNVSKRFVFTPDRPQTILESLVSKFKRHSVGSPKQDLWAVQDISFDVLPGQCLGIIGRNGSGKSTLLKLIARILRPTSGQIQVRGRVSALLELGAGFHPDLTGRENIFLNASVLGFSQEDTERYFDPIVAFSGLAEFIDMPVKHYSSGMYMRLGFSVAIHVNPDVLIVDEILAVGDYAFQTKCIERIYAMRNQGTTIVVVSHDTRTVRNLCSHLLWLEHGKLCMMGTTQDVMPHYIASHEQEMKQAAIQKENGSGPTHSRCPIQLTAVCSLDGSGQKKTSFVRGETMKVEVDYLAYQPVYQPTFDVIICDEVGSRISTMRYQLSGDAAGMVQGRGRVSCTIDALPLLPATYRLQVVVYHEDMIDFREQPFEVVVYGVPEVYGIVEIPATWSWCPTQTQSLADQH